MDHPCLVITHRRSKVRILLVIYLIFMTVALLIPTEWLPIWLRGGESLFPGFGAKDKLLRRLLLCSPRPVGDTIAPRGFLLVPCDHHPCCLFLYGLTTENTSRFDRFQGL